MLCYVTSEENSQLSLRHGRRCYLRYVNGSSIDKTATLAIYVGCCFIFVFLMQGGRYYVWKAETLKEILQKDKWGACSGGGNCPDPESQTGAQVRLRADNYKLLPVDAALVLPETSLLPVRLTWKLSDIAEPNYCRKTSHVLRQKKITARRPVEDGRNAVGHFVHIQNFIKPVCN